MGGNIIMPMDIRTDANQHIDNEKGNIDHKSHLKRAFEL